MKEQAENFDSFIFWFLPFNLKVRNQGYCVVANQIRHMVVGRKTVFGRKLAHMQGARNF